MKRYILILGVVFFSVMDPVAGQKKNLSDANIVGHVISGGKHIPYVTIVVKGTTIGTMTDATGHYMLENLPVDTLVIEARSLGYKPVERQVTTVAGKTLEINFDLEEDVLGMDAVVVTGNRSADKRSSSPVIINTVSPKLFSAIQSVQMREGLNFCPGLRTETDCQNCGFSQLRINGMKGAYSQILINGHAVFSSLAAVYGLELIPSNMIDRIEVIRGGGSALYGSNAIAGTVNILLKDPLNNTFAVSLNDGFVGVGSPGRASTAPDLSVQANASVVSDDHKGGLALFGNYQNKKHFDANDDGLSETPDIRNITFGVRGYHRLGYHSKINFDLFHIAEDRRGGGPMDVPPHEADIAEWVNHQISSGSLSYDLEINNSDELSFYFSGQGVHRHSYYGAEKSLKDYGMTHDFSWVTGLQYKKVWRSWKLVAGTEMPGESMEDIKQGYPDIENAVIMDDTIVSIPHTPDVPVTRQKSFTPGVFFQTDYRITHWLFSVGMRYDHYRISDEINTYNNNSGNVLSPRLSVKYDLSPHISLRGNVSTGYRAPQIFDEDLHIASSGSRKVIIRNDPALKPEHSRSYSLSVSFHNGKSKSPYEFVMEGFYTHLLDPFMNEIGMPDENGVVYYTRKNASSGAIVNGLNLELNIVPANRITLRSGFTFQQSRYQEPQNFGETRFFRTPATYGYGTAEMKVTGALSLSLNYTYTGPMLVPYFGPDQPDPAGGTLRTSRSFHNVGLKGSYDFTLNGSKLQIYAAFKNIFNSYQNDFDTGIDRDPAYIYGPAYPRSIYLGIRFGNVL